MRLRRQLAANVAGAAHAQHQRDLEHAFVTDEADFQLCVADDRGDQ
jgi:hypothetical protein